MGRLENFFKKNSFQCFTYQKTDHLVKLKHRQDNANDAIIFNELKVIVDELMSLPVDFHILDSGDIEIEEL